MKRKAYAKINLALDVKKRLANGYHDLEMIMVPIDLYDEITLTLIEKDEIILKSNITTIPLDESNIVYKIAKAIKDLYRIKQGFQFYIEKNIPSEAGLAGGSTDGACALHLLNDSLNLDLSLDKMVEISKKIGADIPFCLYSKPALVKGIGEKIELIDTKVNYDLLLIKPEAGVKTKEAFETLDLDCCDHPNIAQMKEALSTNSYDLLVASLGNSLEQSALRLNEDIKKIKEELKQLGFYSLMSGSGSCVFALSQDKELLEKGYQFFKQKYNFVKKVKIKSS